MSQIHDLNKGIADKRFNVYMLESHGEFTLIIESRKNGTIQYAEIFGIMITHDAKTKEVRNIVNRAKEYIQELYSDNYE